MVLNVVGACGGSQLSAASSVTGTRNNSSDIDLISGGALQTLYQVLQDPRSIHPRSILVFPTVLNKHEQKVVQSSLMLICCTIIQTGGPWKHPSDHIQLIFL